jgi:hypothetical protein
LFIDRWTEIISLRLFLFTSFLSYIEWFIQFLWLLQQLYFLFKLDSLFIHDCKACGSAYAQDWIWASRYLLYHSSFRGNFLHKLRSWPIIKVARSQLTSIVFSPCVYLLIFSQNDSELISYWYLNCFLYNFFDSMGGFELTKSSSSP